MPLIPVAGRRLQIAGLLRLVGRSNGIQVAQVVDAHDHARLLFDMRTPARRTDLRDFGILVLHARQLVEAALNRFELSAQLARLRRIGLSSGSSGEAGKKNNHQAHRGAAHRNSPRSGRLPLRAVSLANKRAQCNLQQQTYAKRLESA
jgi:hypothetical protein